MKRITVFVLSLVLTLGIFSGLFGQTLIYTQDFTSTFPANWTITNAGSGSNWEIASSYPYNGSYCMQCYYNTYNAANTWAFLQGIYMTAGNAYKVEFYQRVRGSGYPENMKVTVGTAQTVASQTTTLLDLPGVTNTDYTNRVTADFIPTSSGTYYFAFNCYSAANMFALYVDNIRVYETVGSSVIDPTSFTATAGGPDKINLSWTRNSTPDNILLAWNTTNTFGTPSGSYSVGSTISGGGTVLLANSSATNYVHTGRDPETTYYYKIWSQHDDGTKEITYSSGVSANATTPMLPITSFPWVETMETNSPTIDGWLVSSGSPQWTITSDCSGYGIGARSALANFFSFSSTTPFHLYSPTFDYSSLGAGTLSFDYAYATYSGQVDRLDVYYSTDLGNSWVLLQNMPGGTNGILNTGGNVNSGQFVPTASQWNTINLNLPAGANRLRFTATSAYGNNLYVDNVTVNAVYTDPVLTISEQEWDYGLAFANNSSCTPRSFTATNTGGGTISIPSGNVRLEGRDAAHFTLTDNNTYPITLGGGQSASWSVKFNPTCEGEKIAQLVIEDSNGAKYTVAEVTPETASQAELVKMGAFGPVQPRERSLDLTPISFEKPKAHPDTRKVTEPGINMQARQQITIPNSQDEKSHNPITMGQIIPADFSEKDSKSISLRGFGVDPVYEDYFESSAYTHLSGTLTPWTQYDGDGQATYNLQETSTTIIPSYTGSFIALDYTQYSPQPGNSWNAFGGNKYLGCAASQNTDNNDWLISPKLSFGRYPRISFFAKSLSVSYNPESFNVLYSTTGNSYTDFTALNSSPITVGLDWTLFEIQLPYDCFDTDVYFAIQCVSQDMFMLMVDDFVAGSSGCMYAVQSGYWSDENTWSTGTVPNSTDDVCIPDGMTVIVDSEYVSYPDSWNGLYSYGSQANAGSVTVADGGELIIDSGAALLVLGDVDNSGIITMISVDGTVPSNQHTYFFVKGDVTNTQSGTLNFSGKNTNFYLSGDQAQTFTNDGSITGLIYSLVLSNQNGATLAGNNSIPARQVHLASGLMSNSSQLVLGSTNTVTHVHIGNLEQNRPAGSFDEHPSYDENAFIFIYYYSGNSNYSTGYEIPQDGIIDVMVVAMLGLQNFQYDLTMSNNIIISGAADQDLWDDEVEFYGGRLYFDGYALIYNAEDFYISGGEGVYVDDFQVEVDKVTQYDIPGTEAYLHTWETYGTQNGGVEMNFYNPTEWSSVLYVDVYVSDDDGLTWIPYESSVPVINSFVTLEGVTNLGTSTQPRIWAFGNPPVPVELSSFTAAISADNFVNLMWVTQTETGVLGYYVLRHTQNDLSSAITVSELIPATNTSEQQSYIFKDSELFEDGYYYWLQNSDMDGTVSFHGPISIEFSTIGSSVPEIPLVTELKPVYPNPFNPRAFIPFSLKEAANVNFEIYNARGQLVKRIPMGQKAAGNYHTEWDGRDDLGRSCGTGVYHIRMTVGNESYFRKAVLMK